MACRIKYLQSGSLQKNSWPLSYIIVEKPKEMSLIKKPKEMSLFFTTAYWCRNIIIITGTVMKSIIFKRHTMSLLAYVSFALPFLFQLTLSSLSWVHVMLAVYDYVIMRVLWLKMLILSYFSEQSAFSQLYPVSWSNAYTLFSLEQLCLSYLFLINLEKQCGFT